MARKAIVSLAAGVFFGILVWCYVHRSVNLQKQPIILGHGGMGVRHWLPLDSERSVRQALSYPINGTEIDVQMTQDGVLVACHSDSLKSAQGDERVVANLVLSELADFELNGWISTEQIVPLHQLINSEWPDSTVFSLDLKPFGLNSPFQMDVYRAAIIQLIDNHSNYEFLIESTDAQLLKQLRAEKVDAKLFYYSSSATKGLNMIKQFNLDGISIKLSLMTKSDLQSLRQAEILVMIWGTGSVFSNRKALGLQPDYIQTDDIPSMVRLLDLN